MSVGEALDDRLRLATPLAVVLLGMAWALPLPERLGWVPEGGGPLLWVAHLLVPWTAHLGLGVLLVGLVHALRGRVAVAAGLGVVAGLGVAPSGLRSWAPADHRPGANELRVLVWNVEMTPHDVEGALRTIEAADADVVALVEPDQAWVDGLRPLTREWHHTFHVPRPDRFGLAVWSRRPLAKGTTRSFEGIAFADVTVAVEDEAVRLGVVHLYPPKGPEGTARRSRMLEALTDWAQLVDGPRAVVGDLNLTPWSWVYRDLLEASGLADGLAGHGHGPTWPSWLGPLGIPIDHVLVGGGVRVREARVLPDGGSDHLPVLVTLTW